MATEKEKMLAGELYDCGDAELLERWYKAKELQTEYNNTSPRQKEKLAALLDQLLGQRGEDVWIAAPFFVDYGENIFLGNRVEINMNCTFLDCNRITIGDYWGGRGKDGIHKSVAVAHSEKGKEMQSSQASSYEYEL